MRSFYLILFSSFSMFAVASTLAVTLVPLQEPKIALLPIDKDGPNVECDKLAERLEKYNQMARQHDQGVNAFLGEVVQKMNDWYSVLQPLEGSQQNLPEGTFSVLDDGAAKIAMINERAYENTELLAVELDRILVSLRACSQFGK